MRVYTLVRISPLEQRIKNRLGILRPVLLRKMIDTNIFKLDGRDGHGRGQRRVAFGWKESKEYKRSAWQRPRPAVNFLYEYLRRVMCVICVMCVFHSAFNVLLLTYRVHEIQVSNLIEYYAVAY